MDLKQKYIDSVAGCAHQSAVDIIAELEKALSVAIGAKDLIRPGDLKSLGMMDCPVWCIQQAVELWDEDDNLVIHWKTTEGVWFTAEEANEWAENHEHRLGYSWRVYGIAARGQLKTLLKAHTDYSGAENTDQQTSEATVSVNALVALLTEEQRKHLDTALWLTGDGPKASGRTTVLATAFLMKAENNIGKWIIVSDHHRSRMADRSIMLDIYSLFSHAFDHKKYKIEVKGADNSFRIVLRVRKDHE